MSTHPAAPDAIRTRKAGVKVDRIIIHTAQGTLNGTIAWFATPGRSPPTAAHYIIGEAGEIVQMVPDDKRCIHAGSPIEPNWNDRSIGIEHAGFVDDGHPPSDAQLAASAKVTAIMCRKFGIPVDRTRILGHIEVPHRATDAFHTDPGAEWPWARYMAMVTAERSALG